MRKIKTLLLLLVVTLGFCVGIDNIKAEDLPTCNIGYINMSEGINDVKGYGTIQVRTGSWDNTTATNAQIYSCPSSGNCSLWTAWKKERSFYFEARVPRGKILDVRYRFYKDTDGKKNTRDEPICNGELPASIDNNKGTVTVSFNLTNGNIEAAEIWVDYEDENGNRDTLNASRWVGKKIGDGQSEVTNIPTNSNTTTPTSKPPAQSGSMWGDDGMAYTGDGSGTTKEDYSTGYGATMDKSNIGGGSTENACNSVNALFDYFWPYVMIIIPVALIILIAIDFFKAMASNDNDSIKKAGTNTVKRTIAAIMLLALPVIVRFIFELVGLDFCL